MMDKKLATESPSDDLSPGEISTKSSSSSDISDTCTSYIKDSYDKSVSSPSIEQNGSYIVDSPSFTLDPDPPDKSIVEILASPDTFEGPPSAKDGGYGWVVVFVVFIVNVVSAGYIKSFGITYTLILDYFPDTSGAAGGWIMGLLVGCRGLLSPAMGALTVLIGPRKCVIIGTLICVTGLLLAVPAFSITYFAFTLGALVGIGMCMSETPGFLVVTDYFEKKRTLANGFRAAGNPMGGILFAPMMVLLQQHYGLRGAFIMVAGLMLQLVVCGMLMRPFHKHKQIVENQYWMTRRQSISTIDQQIANLKVQQAYQLKKKKKPLDFTFFKNPPYLVYLVMVLCTNMAMPNALLYAPVYGRLIGLTDLQNSLIASYTSCCDFVMRLFCGWIFNKKIIKTEYGFIAGLVIGGIGCLIVPLCTNLWSLLIFATMLSLCMASFWTLVNVLLADQFGGEAMASTWGFFRMTQGICSFIYPSIIGFIMDMTGGMTVPYIVMGLSLVVGAIIYALQPLIAKLPGSKITLP
ncbi:hypothetical protein SK128_020427 [Halocaridina rubra]|uniref:Major facilitator superfamily (MFS) profile domain-containing protein n=1 Tax=Halocaridina rubra TaxID=373956 RepID=A0AAN8WPQ6_HALRR